MKFLPLSLLVLITSLVAFANPALAKSRDTLQVGDRVAAQWTDGKYYIGTISKIAAKIHVAFDDGDGGPIAPKLISVIPQNAQFKVGSHVLAVWQKGAMFPGVVTQVRPNQCVVKWDDGDQPTLVKKDQMLLWP